MKTKIIIITLILLGLSISGYFVYKVLSIPKTLKSILLDNLETPTVGSDSIYLRIDSIENIYINDLETKFELISSRIDSLGSVGFNDSVIIINADTKVKIEKVVQVMNYARETNKRVILRSD